MNVYFIFQSGSQAYNHLNQHHLHPSPVLTTNITMQPPSYHEAISETAGQPPAYQDILLTEQTLNVSAETPSENTEQAESPPSYESYIDNQYSNHWI